VELLTIGTFSRASRLSPKALRLYDSLGLLAPAHVDEVSGYRFYRPDQLERARLVAWLRRLGMPLARIQVVCDLAASAPDQAAAQVSAFWAETEAELTSRRALATHLISYLSGEDAMSGTTPALAIRYAARSDIGRHRDRNQDTAYASGRLLAVADGMGAAGSQASAAVIEALKPLETALPAGDLLNAMEDAVRRADPVLRDLAATDPGTGTTLTAMLLSGSQLALVHVGDTRAYLLRDGDLFQITHDHSVVQALLDEGKITPEEADSHPQRSLLLRAMDGERTTEPDVSLHDARAGDRYLLCSDGLTAVVGARVIQDALSVPGDAEQAVDQLIGLANEAGGPDNIACVVADVIKPPAHSAE
jgi:serine/threonine protein phosphatase PrpC